MVIFPVHPSADYLAQIQAWGKEGLGVATTQQLPEIQGWARRMPKRAVEATLKIINQDTTLRIEAGVKQTLFERLNDTPKALTQAARLKNLNDMQAILAHPMDARDVDRLFRLALSQGEVVVAEILGPHRDGVDGHLAVCAAIDTDHPVDSSICIALFDALSPKDQADHWLDVLRKAAGTMTQGEIPRVDVFRTLCLRVSTFQQQVCDSEIQDALNLSVGLLDDFSTAWLVQHTACCPENVMRLKFEAHEDAQTDHLACHLGAADRAAWVEKRPQSMPRASAMVQAKKRAENAGDALTPSRARPGRIRS